MPDKEFNLLREPWILVMKHDGSTDEVSLLDVFRHAHEYCKLSGELPTQDFVILRLLLAIMHTVFGRYNLEGQETALCDSDTEEALNRWQTLYELGHFPMNLIETYLSKWEERFYLFHPQTPFYQVADLNKGTEYQGCKLNGMLSESGNKLKWFSPRSHKTKNLLTYPEAARWLLNVNAYDDTSSKATVRGGILPSIGAGWLGKLGAVYASGKTLFETLMLNFITVRDSRELYGKENPIWERPVKADERTQIKMPDNLSELYTLQSRRLRLNRTKEYVTGYLLIGGDFFPRENASIEPMTKWRNTAKKASDPASYIPARHSANRQIWRDIESLLLQNGCTKPPEIIKWISFLQSGNSGRLLSKKKLISFKTPGIAYADKDFFVEDIIDDTLTIHTSLLQQVGQAWIERIIDQIVLCDQLVFQLGTLAKNLALAAGADVEGPLPDGSKSKAMTLGYDALDRPFRAWLETLAPSHDNKTDDIQAACDKWWETAQKIIRAFGKKLIAEAGPKAFVGHKPSKDKAPITSPKSYNLFLYKTSSPEALKSKGGKK